MILSNFRWFYQNLLLISLTGICFLQRNAVQGYAFTNFQPADLAIGQADLFGDNVIPSQIVVPSSAGGSVNSNGMLVVADRSFNRVLIWNRVPISNGTPADVVIGQTNFTSGISGTSAFALDTPHDADFSSDGKKLIVCDAANNRLLIWNNIPTSNGTPADVVVGQINFTSKLSLSSSTNLGFPTSAAITSDGKLIVADYLLHRVLIYHSIPTTNNAPADIVIGQANMNDNVFGNNAAEMGHSGSVAVSPDGKLLIADESNHRVMVYNRIPTSNGAPADVVIGQKAFGNSTPGSSATNLNAPWGGVAISPAGQLAIADRENHRVLFYDSVPVTNGAVANAVLGQPNFTNNGYFIDWSGPKPQSMGMPFIPWFDPQGQLFVSGDYRIMMFAPLTSTTPSSNVTSTTDFNADAFPDILMQKKDKVTILTGGTNTFYHWGGLITLPANNKVLIARHLNTNNYLTVKIGRQFQIKKCTTVFIDTGSSFLFRTPKQAGSKIVASGDLNQDDSLDLITIKGKKLSVVFGPGYSNFFTFTGIVSNNSLGKVVGIYFSGLTNILVLQKGKRPVTLAALSSTNNSVTAVISTGFTPSGKILGFSGSNPIYYKKGIVTAGFLSYTNKPAINNLGRVVGPK